jgi:hypothetical protein
MRSPWRELGETRTVTVDAHGIWLRMCLPWLLFSHGAVLTPKSQKPLVTVSPPANQSIRRVTLLPLSDKVARRRKSFQFSLAVCLVTGHSTTILWRWRRHLWQSQLNQFLVGRSLGGGGGVSLHLEKRFPRIVIRFPLISRSVNAK